MGARDSREGLAATMAALLLPRKSLI